MRKLNTAILAVCLCAFGCDDKNETSSICDKECGSGTCYMNGTYESCLCDKGFTTNVDGVCSLCKKGYHPSGSSCKADTPCTDQCEGEHRTCTVVDNAPVCGCKVGFLERTQDGRKICQTTQACLTTFRYTNPNAAGQKVYVTGDFDGWQHNTYQLTETSPGVFEGNFNLEWGFYLYKFYVAEWGDDGWKTSGDENGDNLMIHVPTCSNKVRPKLKVTVQPTISGNSVSFAVSLVDNQSLTQNVYIQVMRDGEKIASQAGNSIQVNDTLTSRKTSYTVTATSSNGVEIWPIYVPVWNEQEHFDWRDAVMYFAFIDRFNNGNKGNDAPLGVRYDWMGGDFAGLKAKVDAGYFDNLGVNALWISSVSMNTQSPQEADGFTMSAYHSYWPLTTGYSEKTASMFDGALSNNVAITPIEPHFGTLDELKALVKSCHDRGIRVLIDFAVNHVHDESPIYLKNPDWFNMPAQMCTGNAQKNWDNIPETCWFGKNLPDFNYNLEDPRQAVLEHANWLIRTTDVDGFRLDAVKHMPISFISDLRETLDDTMAESGQIIYVVGETFDYNIDTIKKYIGDTLLHGQFDFLLYDKIRQTIMGDKSFEELMKFNNNNDSTYGSAIMSSFLGNHDVPRAISAIHGDSGDKYGYNNAVNEAWSYRRLKLAWTFLMTSPDIPMIYYGDEFGLEGANDPDNRRMMRFDQELSDLQRETLGHVQALGKARRKHPALSRGTRHNIGAMQRSYMYLMQGFGETILVGISDSDDDQEYDVEVGSKGWINILNESEPVWETTHITLTKERHIIVWKLKD